MWLRGWLRNPIQQESTIGVLQKAGEAKNMRKILLIEEQKRALYRFVPKPYKKHVG
jgi:hypothetical protein